MSEHIEKKAQAYLAKVKESAEFLGITIYKKDEGYITSAFKAGYNIASGELLQEYAENARHGTRIT